MRLLEKTIEACIKAGLVSGRHVAVDGTVIKANAAMGSIEPIEPPLSLREHLLKRCGWVKFVPKKTEEESRTEKDADPRPGGSADFRGHTRSNATHRSTTDPDALLYRKSSSTGAELAYLGHVAGHGELSVSDLAPVMGLMCACMLVNLGTSSATGGAGSRRGASRAALGPGKPVFHTGGHTRLSDKAHQH